MRDREARRFASHGAESECESESESESRFALTLRFCSIEAGKPSEKVHRERKKTTKAD